jgi:hypothetical protein
MMNDFKEGDVVTYYHAPEAGEFYTIVEINEKGASCQANWGDQWEKNTFWFYFREMVLIKSKGVKTKFEHFYDKQI